MNPDTARKAIRRSILKQEGARRVDVMLGQGSLDDLAIIRERLGLKTSEAVAYAVSYVADIVTARK